MFLSEVESVRKDSEIQGLALGAFSFCAHFIKDFVLLYHLKMSPFAKLNATLKLSFLEAFITISSLFSSKFFTHSISSCNAMVISGAEFLLLFCCGCSGETYSNFMFFPNS